MCYCSIRYTHFINLIDDIKHICGFCHGNHLLTFPNTTTTDNLDTNYICSFKFYKAPQITYCADTIIGHELELCTCPYLCHTFKITGMNWLFKDHIVTIIRIRFNSCSNG